MKEDLIKLRNTLGMIETRDAGTRLMAQCLTFVEEMIQREQEAEHE